MLSMTNNEDELYPPFKHVEDQRRRQGRVSTLPRIEHPSNKFNQQSIQSMDVRGISRNGFGNGQIIRNESSLDDSNNNRRERRASSLSSTSTTNSLFKDRTNQVRLPLFGQGKDLRKSTIEEESNENDRLDLYLKKRFVKEKVNKQFNEIQRKFIQISNGHPDGKISRQALHHLIASIFGVQQQIKPKEIDELLEYIQLKQLDKISFQDFCQSLSISVEDRLNSSSLSLSKHSKSDLFYSRPTAKQMFDILQEKYSIKDKDLFRFIPQLNGSNQTNSKIYKNQFQRVLFDLDYHIEQKQFDRLWDKFDQNGFNSVETNEFIQRLINNEDQQINSNKTRLTSETQDQQMSILRSQTNEQIIQMPEEIDFYFQSERDLKELEKIFQELDEERRGMIERDQLIEILKEYTLYKINQDNFDRFLKLIHLENSQRKSLISYRDLLNRLNIQLRSSTNKNKNKEEEWNEFQSPLFGQIQYLIRSNLKGVRSKLMKLDQSKKGIVSHSIWKEFLEDLIEFSLSPNEYQMLKKNFPLDSNDFVRWKDFIDDLSSSLTESKLNDQNDQNQSKQIPQWNYMRSTNIRQCLDLKHLDNKRKSPRKSLFDPSSKEKSNKESRSFDQIRLVLKQIIRDRYKDMEQSFDKLDQSSYRELNQDLLYRLFQSLSIEPQINREEIDLIWSNCHLKENGNLDFDQFLRQFGYSKGSAHYPNAKTNPPKRGDADFLLTSRKLYGDSVLVQGSTLNSIRSNWFLLKEDFNKFDPYQTGFVQSIEFDEILSQCCPLVNDDDLFYLKDKFLSKDSSRVNYILFLKHYSSNKSFPSESHHQSTTNQQISNEKRTNSILESIFDKIRDQMNLQDKSIQRLFKQKDPTNSGLISIQSFRSILNENQLFLNDEEFYFLISEFDRNNRSLIDYRSFIRTILK